MMVLLWLCSIAVVVEGTEDSDVHVLMRAQ